MVVVFLVTAAVVLRNLQVLYNVEDKLYVVVLDQWLEDAEHKLERLERVEGIVVELESTVLHHVFVHDIFDKRLRKDEMTED